MTKEEVRELIGDLDEEERFMLCVMLLDLRQNRGRAGSLPETDRKTAQQPAQFPADLLTD